VPQQNDTPTCYASALSPTRPVKVHRHLVKLGLGSNEVNDPCISSFPTVSEDLAMPLVRV